MIALVREDFITPDEQTELSAWITREWAWASGETLAPKGWRGTMRWKTPPPVFFTVAGRVIRWLKLTDEQWARDPKFGWTVNYQPEFSWVLVHQDLAPPGKAVIRANVLVARPPAGGTVFIADQEILVRERAAWALNTTRPHGTARHLGGPRLICSYGFLVSDEAAVLQELA